MGTAEVQVGTWYCLSLIDSKTGKQPVDDSVNGQILNGQRRSTDFNKPPKGVLLIFYRSYW